MPNSIRKRLRLHQDWTNDLPLKNIWGINFSSRTGSGAMANVGDAIEYYLDVYRPRSFRVDTELFDRVSDTEVGFLLAQNVAMPKESFNVSNKADLPTGGFQPYQLGGNRSSDNNVDVTFIETNKDIFSFFIQPWIVAASYAGLIEDDNEPDIKCNIDIIEYSRSSEKYGDKVGESNKRQRNNDVVEYGIRKMHTFYDCVPQNLDTDKLAYDEIKMGDISRTTSFNFAHYQLNTPRGVLDGI